MESKGEIENLKFCRLKLIGKIFAKCYFVICQSLGSVLIQSPPEGKNQLKSPTNKTQISLKTEKQ